MARSCNLREKLYSSKLKAVPLQFENLWTEDMLKVLHDLKLESLVPSKGEKVAKKIAIIGGGPAGLVAAYELSKANLAEIDIYEKSDRLGGRVYTVGMIGGFTEESTPWVNDSIEDPTYGEIGAMRLPLIPEGFAKEALAKSWLKSLSDKPISSLNDEDINSLVHADVVSDTYFPMPLVRHYIKELGIPVRRFNMNVSVAHIDQVQITGNQNYPLTAYFVRKDDKLVNIEDQSKSLDDAAWQFLEAYQGEGQSEIQDWMKSQKHQNLNCIFHEDVTELVIFTLTKLTPLEVLLLNKDNFLDAINHESWDAYLKDWNLSYRKQLQQRGWPERVIKFYGDIYRFNMNAIICQDIIEEELGHWWQPNMYTPKFGMHSIYDAPKNASFQGFRQKLEQNKHVTINFNSSIYFVENSENCVTVIGTNTKDNGIFQAKYDAVLVTIPIPNLIHDIAFYNVNLPISSYKKDQLIKTMFQFKSDFWNHAENNLGGFEMNEHSGFAVVASSKHKPITQFRYSNSEFEGNVIMDYEAELKAVQETVYVKSDKILDALQQFHTINVQDEAYFKKNEEKPGIFRKSWIPLVGMPYEDKDVDTMQNCCDGNSAPVFFAGDSWSFCPQWQEGAMMTAVVAVHRMLNYFRGIHKEEDPFYYTKN